MIGTYLFVLLSSLYDTHYTQAQKIRALIAHGFNRAWTLCSFLLPPTASSAAFYLSNLRYNSDNSIVLYLNNVFTVPSSWTELPMMSVLGRLDHQILPLGFQVIGHPFDAQGILNAGLPIKECADFVVRANYW